jgi:hypothetical protein
MNLTQTQYSHEKCCLCDKLHNEDFCHENKLCVSCRDTFFKFASSGGSRIASMRNEIFYIMDIKTGKQQKTVHFTAPPHSRWSYHDIRILRVLNYRGNR